MHNAREFKHWATAELFSSIRRDGEYIHASKEMSKEEILARAVLLG